MHHDTYSPHFFLSDGDTFVFNRELYTVAYEKQYNSMRCERCSLRSKMCGGTPACFIENSDGCHKSCTFQKTVKDPYTLLRLKGEIDASQ